MRPSTVRRLVRTVPLAAVVAGAAGYALLPVEAGAGARPVRSAAPAPSGVALVAPVADARSAPEGTAPTATAPGATTPAGTAGPGPSGTTSAVPTGSAPGTVTPTAPATASGPASTTAKPAETSKGVPTPTGTAPPSDPAPATTPTAPAPTTGTAPDWPEEMPAAVAERVDVAIRSLSGAWEIRGGGSYFEFEVTWTNATDRRFDEVVPVVRVLPFDYPAAVARLGATAKGLLDRKDIDEWREVKPDQKGVDSGPQQGAFALDPGESRAVRYRLTLAADSMSGRLPIQADGYVGRGAKALSVGGTQARMNVTTGQPVRFSATKATDMTVGRIPSELRVELANLDATGNHTVSPVVRVTDPLGRNTRHGLVPGDLSAEVLVEDEWRRLPGALDADGQVRLDTSGLTRVLGPGETAVYPFRFNVPKGWNAGSGLEFTVGGTADGGALPTQKARPRITWMADDTPKASS
ncbi:hypothetical protein [Kitasatospora purpeofusca]|uniref:Uncharacterized protein n=1 Tax=Kitasatospora purpeofusca TaxID=67352 RepID=A0ABZ1U3W1_9ACTN|nr:hypothetical protein [Kitasatospora purpeofusca]